MFLFVFGGIKRRSDEISKFQFSISANWVVATFSSKTFLEMLVIVVFVLIYFAALSLGFE